jgi:hypothetical protein
MDLKDFARALYNGDPQSVRRLLERGKPAEAEIKKRANKLCYTHEHFMGHDPEGDAEHPLYIAGKGYVDAFDRCKDYKMAQRYFACVRVLLTLGADATLVPTDLDIDPIKSHPELVKDHPELEALLNGDMDAAVPVPDAAAAAPAAAAAAAPAAAAAAAAAAAEPMPPTPPALGKKSLWRSWRFVALPTAEAHRPPTAGAHRRQRDEAPGAADGEAPRQRQRQTSSLNAAQWESVREWPTHTLDEERRTEVLVGLLREWGVVNFPGDEGARDMPAHSTEGPKPGFFCKVCRGTSSTLEQLHIHLEGQPHKQKTLKLKEGFKKHPDAAWAVAVDKIAANMLLRRVAKNKATSPPPHRIPPLY